MRVRRACFFAIASKYSTLLNFKPLFWCFQPLCWCLKRFQQRASNQHRTSSPWCKSIKAWFQCQDFQLFISLAYACKFIQCWNMIEWNCSKWWMHWFPEAQTSKDSAVLCASQDCKNPSAALMVRINGSAGRSLAHHGMQCWSRIFLMNFSEILTVWSNWSEIIVHCSIYRLKHIQWLANNFSLHFLSHFGGTVWD